MCSCHAALSPVASSGPVVPGSWNTDFSAVLEYSETNKVPMVVFLGSVHCEHCQTLVDEVFNTSMFNSWRSERGLAMAFCESRHKYSDSEFKMSNVFKWFKADKAVTKIPMVGVCWPKPDGTSVTNTFPGRSGEMPVTDGTLAEQLISSIEQVIGAYGKYDGGTFALSNTDGSHLEIVPGVAEWIDIPLKRGEGLGFATNHIAAAYSDADGTRRIEHAKICWSAGETSRLARIGFRFAPAGDVKLDISDVSSNVVASCSACVRTNLLPSIGYPLFVNERTADTLGWGEWTMDLDVAKSKVAASQGDAYVLVGVGGDLWCPDCHGIASSLYADKSFVDWAKSNQVALVSIDQPRYGARTASMLSYEEDSKGVSGAFYLSSKMIPMSVAEEVFERNAKFSYETYLLPSSGAVRLANPTLLLFNKTGNIVGRLNLRTRPDKTCPAAENIARLNELLRMADAGCKGESRKDPSTTGLSIESDGGTLETFLSVNDNSAVIALKGIKAGHTAISLQAPAGKPVEVELFTADGTYPGRKTLAKGPGSVAWDFGAGTHDNVFVRISSYEDAASVDCSTAGDSGFGVTISASFTPVPGCVAFAAAGALWQETAGTGAVSVFRSGGISGRAAVRITVDESKTTATGRYEFTPIDVVWNDGESGMKSYDVAIVQNPEFEGRGQLVLKLEPIEGNMSEVASPASFTATIFDTEDPVFGQLSYVFTFHAGFKSQHVLPLHNIKEGDSVSFKRLEGSLPSGISLKYDKVSANAILSSSATRAAEKSCVYSISVRRKNGRTAETIKGPGSEFLIRVVDPKQEGLNPYLSTAYSMTIPVISETNGVRTLAGTLALGLTSKNKISAKYSGVSAKSISFSGTWQELDVDSGMASSVLKTRTGFTLSLQLSGDGIVSGTLSESDGVHGALLLESTAIGNTSGYLAYAGLYTVTFPIATNGLVAGGMNFAGTGYLSLKATSSSFGKNGKISYAGMTPDGQAISGSATLASDAYQDPAGNVKYGMLPVFKNASKNVFGALLILRKGGAAEISAAPYDSDVNPQIVRNHPEVCPYLEVKHPCETWIACECFGGFYDPKISIWDLLEAKHGGTHEYGLSLNAHMLHDSERYGSIEALPEALAVNDGEKFSLINQNGSLKAKLKFAKNTGLVTGTVPVVFANGKKVNASFKAILLPGWHDCQCGYPYDPIERPLASGVASFTDYLSGKSVKRTFSVDLMPAE